MTYVRGETNWVKNKKGIFYAVTYLETWAAGWVVGSVGGGPIGAVWCCCDADC